MKNSEYFSTKSIWLIFDLNNVHKGFWLCCKSTIHHRKHIWWFNTKKKAMTWLKIHKQCKIAPNTSHSQQWMKLIDKKIINSLRKTIIK